MSILDNVVADSEPLVVTVDFGDYKDGGKLTSLFKLYFNKRQEKLGLEDGDYSGFVAEALLTSLKDVIAQEERAAQQARLQQALLDIEEQRALASGEVSLVKAG